HNAVAQELIDRPFVAVHLPQHQFEGPVHELMHLFGIELFRHRGEPGDVGEQDRDLLAFAFQRRPGGENFLGEGLWRVALGGGEACGWSWRWDQGLTAFMAELIGRRVARATAGAAAFNPRPAFAAELHPIRVVMAALRALHTVPPWQLLPAGFRASSAGVVTSHDAIASIRCWDSVP